MAKLKLIANPTFAAKVAIPVAGGASVDVEFTFKHRTKAQMDEFLKERDGKPITADTLLEMVSAWELEDEFGKASMELLMENYIGAALAIYLTYIDELYKAKAKN
jgi:hypothetical protein